MCGLAGYSIRGNLTKSGVQALAQIRSALAEAADKRGDDSYGIVHVTEQGKHVHVTRGLGSIKPNVGLIPLDCGSIMIHTRSRTVGEATIQNAHPFSMGGILGAHNGVVSNWRSIESKAKAKWTVDSQAFIHLISQGDDCKDLEAWGAVTWVKEDKPDAGVYLCRLSSGSLDLADGILPGGAHIVVWASVLPKNVLPRLDDATEYVLEGGKVYLAQNGGIYVTKRELKAGTKTRTVYYGNGRGGDSWYENYDNENAGTGYGQALKDPTPTRPARKRYDQCKCGHPFYKHSRVTDYGGTCFAERACRCFDFDYDEKASIEIHKQMEEMAKKQEQSAKTKTAEAAAEAVCLCGHSEKLHKKKVNRCKASGCACSRFWDYFGDGVEDRDIAQVGMEYDSEVYLRTGLYVAKNCPNLKCSNKKTCKECWEVAKSIYDSQDEKSPKQEEQVSCSTKSEQVCEGPKEAEQVNQGFDCMACGYCADGKHAPICNTVEASAQRVRMYQESLERRNLLPLPAVSTPPPQANDNIPVGGSPIADQGVVAEVAKAEISATLQKLGEEAGKMAKAKTGMVAGCDASICKLNQKCLAVSCPTLRGDLISSASSEPVSGLWRMNDEGKLVPYKPLGD